MTDTELLDWFDMNKVDTGFAVTTPDGEPVIVTGDTIRQMLMTAISMRGIRHDVQKVNKRVH